MRTKKIQNILKNYQKLIQDIFEEIHYDVEKVIKNLKY